MTFLKSIIFLIAAVVLIPAVSVGEEVCTITTVAGNGTRGFSGDGGPATAAKLNDPKSIAVDSAGNLYIADTGSHRVRKVDANGGIIHTVAGGGDRMGYPSAGNNVPATEASFYSLSDITLDPAGNLYIVDTDTHFRDGGTYIRKVDVAGLITTVPHPFYDYGYGRHWVDAIATSGTGTLYAIMHCSVYRININRDHLVAGVGNCPLNRERMAERGGIPDEYREDGVPATRSALHTPRDIAFDLAGNIYIADEGTHRIRKVDANGIIHTVAGGGGLTRFSGDGGLATAASVGDPTSVAVDLAGNLYIADSYSDLIRKVDANGIIHTVAGGGSLMGSSGDGGLATAASLRDATSVAVDPDGNLYISDFRDCRVWKVTCTATNGAGGTDTGGADGGETATGGEGSTTDETGVTESICGNGVKEPSETCDDGRQNGRPNKCNISCSGNTVPVCGNGIIESGEKCDDGTANDDIKPSACRTNCTKGSPLQDRKARPKKGWRWK